MLHGPTTVSLPREQVAGRQLPHARHDRAGTRDVAEHEESIDRGRVELAQLRLSLKERRQFGGKQQLAVALVHEQRLLAEAVARQEQASAGLVPESEGEHALQRVDQRVAELLVQVHEHLGVAARGEAMTARGQILAQARVVVDLAVEDHPNRAVLVAERLVPALDVHDRQTPDPDRDAGVRICVQTLVVRPAVAHRRGHGPHVASLGVVSTASYSAHWI